MDLDYAVLRNWVDSWGLAITALIFLVLIYMALRPSARKAQEEASLIPFKED